MALRWHVGLPGPFALSGRVFPRRRPRARTNQSSADGLAFLVVLALAALVVALVAAAVAALIAVCVYLALCDVLAWLGLLVGGSLRANAWVVPGRIEMPLSRAATRAIVGGDRSTRGAR